MKKWRFICYVLLALGLTIPAFGAEIELHGDLNHRFLLYTNHTDWLNPDQKGEINPDKITDTFGELKYRFWFEAASNDGDIKGVYAIEIGGIRFGEKSTNGGKGKGGSFSGDEVNVETRWAYLDWQIPGVDTKARFEMGLFPFNVNEFIWKETAAGVVYNGAPKDNFGYQIGWIRGVENTLARTEDEDRIKDNENFLARFNFRPSDNVKLGVFGLYQLSDPKNPTPTLNPTDLEVKIFADKIDFDLFTIGVDGGADIENWFVRWDLMYQTGDIRDVQLDDLHGAFGPGGLDILPSGDFDVSGYFAHVDVGYTLGKTKITGTAWYASGDDNAFDTDIDAFIATDLDREDNIGIFEGLYTDDDIYFTERPYILDKGFLMLKLALDHQATERLTLGGAVMYMETAEDIEYADAAVTRSFSNSDIGYEIDLYLKYMLYKNLEFAINAGYLFAGDALDAFEVDSIRDGNSDEDIWASSCRIRYKF